MVTAAHMVNTVMVENSNETAIIPFVSWFAAGIMTNGINISQGPKTKMINNTHGVNNLALFA